jgi:hypothetical protein
LDQRATGERSDGAAGHQVSKLVMGRDGSRLGQQIAWAFSLDLDMTPTGTTEAITPSGPWLLSADN